jgi:NitT/TauT family transport system substrate-binding protein
MQASWVNAHKDDVQKLVNAYVKTMTWIAGHSATEIADKMPRDYYGGDKDGYIKALSDSKAMFTPDGKMPAGGPEQVLKVMQAFSPTVMGKTIDLSKTYTNQYVEAALKR